MSKTVIGAIVVVILAAGGWYVYSQKGGTGAAMMQTNTETPSAMQSMKDLVASGVSQKCDFTEPQSGTNGTIYIAGGKVRGDFSSKTQAGTIAGHMISDGTTVNTWMDGMSQGFKSSFTASAAPGNTDSQKGLDPDKKTDYKCSPWSADQSKFQLPSGITFTDMSAMMQGSMKAGADIKAGAMPGKAAQCSACDMAPEPQKSQCRQALGCK